MLSDSKIEMVNICVKIKNSFQTRNDIIEIRSVTYDSDAWHHSKLLMKKPVSKYYCIELFTENKRSYIHNISDDSILLWIG
jgi:hypothetical protein